MVARGILESLEGRVLLEALREVLGSLRVEPVTSETANERRVGPSVAIDSNGKGTGSEEAYSMLVSVLFTVSMSATCFAPSAPRLLKRRLQTRVEWRC